MFKKKKKNQNRTPSMLNGFLVKDCYIFFHNPNVWVAVTGV